MKWTRDQYIDLMTYNNPERPMFSELFGPIVGLDREWQSQGADEKMLALDAFSFDYVPYFGVGNLGIINGFAPTVIENTPTRYVGTDSLGRTVCMDKITATIPLPQDYPVKNMDDWLKIKHMFEYESFRISEEEIQKALTLQSQGYIIKVNLLGGFDILRELMGEVNCCIAFYDDPELIIDILDTITDMTVRCLEKITDRITIDQLMIHEDMAGKTAPLIGPDTVEQFIIPYYKKAWEVANAAGTELFAQDSDGNMNILIDTFMSGGVNVFYPCEPAGGMDIVALRKKYGKKISFLGGIDKHVLRRTKEEIKAEIDYKMQPVMMDGGIVFGLDHRIPNGTPLENYIYYIDCARNKLGLPDFRISDDSWGRMAF